MKKLTNSSKTPARPKKRSDKPTPRSSTKKTAAKSHIKAGSKHEKAGSGLSLKKRVAAARKLEALDSKPPKAKKTTKLAAPTPPQRNGDFPNTYIKTISVALDDPDHPMTLEWTGPQASGQQTGPFRNIPGAGMSGIKCDITSTSIESGTKCTPKGTFAVEGFQSALNSDARATYVTWFQRWRGIGLHYFPSVPKYAASHGCVRIEQQLVAQLVQSNSRVGLTQVVVSGTWTKPPKQW